MSLYYTSYVIAAGDRAGGAAAGGRGAQAGLGLCALPQDGPPPLGR